MQRPHIVGYTYQSDNYCPVCVICALGLGEVTETVEHVDGSVEVITSEQVLDLLAQLRRINRDDETSFDTSEFPKVITRLMVDADPCTTTCGSCDEQLGYQDRLHHYRANVTYDDRGNAASWDVRACYCQTPWQH